MAEITVSKRVLNWIARHGKRPMAIPALSLLSVGDFFIPALPTQTSVMLLAWLQPKKAWLIAFLFALASAIGTSLLAALALMLDNYLVSFVPSEGSKGYEHWQWLTGLVQEYGLIALATLCLLPTPPRTLVVLSILSGLSISAVIAMVFMGKLVWFLAVVTCVYLAPKWLSKVPWIGQFVSKQRHRASSAVTTRNINT